MKNQRFSNLDAWGERILEVESIQQVEAKNFNLQGLVQTVSECRFQTFFSELHKTNHESSIKPSVLFLKKI
jgi:hypothetical protein